MKIGLTSPKRYAITTKMDSALGETVADMPIKRKRNQTQHPAQAHTETGRQPATREMAVLGLHEGFANFSIGVSVSRGRSTPSREQTQLTVTVP